MHLADIWIYLLHPLGGRGYQWWSGLGSDISEVALIGGALTLFRHHNCHARGCWRLGRHPVEGTPYRTCATHHPSIQGRSVPVAEIHAAHREAQEGAIKVREGE